MTITTMLALIGYHLDDPNGERYTNTIKLAALDEVLEFIAGTVDEKLIPGLQSNTDLNNITATGTYLPSDYLRYVSGYLYGLDRWVTKVNVSNIDILDNTFSKGSDIDPIVYIWNNSLYLRVSTYSGSYNDLRLFYIKKPAALTTVSTIPVHESLHTAMIDYAEGKLKLAYKFGDPQEAVAQITRSMEVISSLSKGNTYAQ